VALFGNVERMQSKAGEQKEMKKGRKGGGDGGLK
jgi:hypothetical protein